MSRTARILSNEWLVIRRGYSSNEGGVVIGAIVATGAGSSSPRTREEILNVGGDRIENLDPSTGVNGVGFLEISYGTLPPDLLAELLVVVEFCSLRSKELASGVHLDGTFTLDTNH
jgi:hypothetical protein